MPTLSDAQLARHRSALESIRTGRLEKALAPLRADIGDQGAIAKLGPAPTGAQTEAEMIAAQRKDLTETLKRLEGAKKQLELVAVEAEQAGGRAADLQKDRFFSRIFEPGLSIFNPDLWSDAMAGAGQFSNGSAHCFKTWSGGCTHDAKPLVLLLIPAIFAAAYGLYGLGIGWFRRRFRPARPDHRSR